MNFINVDKTLVNIINIRELYAVISKLP